MGWLDYHLHEFEVKEPGTGEIIEIGIPSEFFFDEIETEPGGKKKSLIYFYREQKSSIQV